MRVHAARQNVFGHAGSHAMFTSPSGLSRLLRREENNEQKGGIAFSAHCSGRDHSQPDPLCVVLWPVPLHGATIYPHHPPPALHSLPRHPHVQPGHVQYESCAMCHVQCHSSMCARALSGSFSMLRWWSRCEDLRLLTPGHPPRPARGDHDAGAGAIGWCC